MIKIDVLTDRHDIEKIKQEWLELARREKAPLPFQYPFMPLTYWDVFHDDEEPFWKKRGKNFLGMRSNLHRFYLLTAWYGNELCGVLPLGQFAVMLGGGEQINMVAVLGDYVLHPFQDFLVAGDRRQAIIGAMLQVLPEFFRDNSLVWLGYIPGHSPNLPIIREASSMLQDCDSLEAISSQRGGVWPWTITGITKILLAIKNICEKEEKNIPELESFLERIEGMSETALLFPSTRSSLETELQDLLEILPKSLNLVELSKKIESFLQNSPILYPYIELPPTRQDYLRSLTRKTRRTFKYFTNVFKKQCAKIEVVSSNNITPEDIDDYIRLHIARWGDKSESICGKSARYHREMSIVMGSKGGFSLFFVKLNNKRVAVVSCFDNDGRREAYIPGRDPNYERLSAGSILLLHTIYDAIDKGLKRYELGPLGFTYKMKFVKQSGSAHNFFFHPSGTEPDLNKIFASFECMEPCLFQH